MLDRVYAFSRTVGGADFDQMQVYLERCQAFLEPTEGVLRF